MSGRRRWQNCAMRWTRLAPNRSRSMQSASPLLRPRPLKPSPTWSRSAKKEDALRQKAEVLEQDIARMEDKPSTKKLALDADLVIAERHQPLPKNASKRLQSGLQKRLNALGKERNKRRAATQKALTKETAHGRDDGAAARRAPSK